MSSLWQEARTGDGRVYYYNTANQTTQWTKPVELMSPAEKALQDLPWKEHKAADGRPYWYHAQTRETTWTMPDAYKEALDKVNQGAAAPQAPAFVAGGVQQFPQHNNERQVALPGQMMEAGHDGTAKPMSLPSAKDFAGGDRSNEPQYHSFDEAESAFIKLLRRNNVAADWTWEKAMRAVIKEPQYRALKDPKDRKAAFEKYIVELKQQEQEKAKDRMAKLRQDFSVMLKSHPEIKYYTRWKTARPMIEGETIFRSTSDEEERRQLFNEYVAELRKTHLEDEAKKRREAVDDLIGLLKSLNMEPYTRWSEAQKTIQENELFQSEAKFQALSKLDVLNAFESHIKVLERSFNDERQRIKAAKSRKERKAREAFVALLNSLRAKGEIRVGSKWKQVYPLFKDDERYLNMLGQTGSTPLDLFWDMVEDMERDIRLKRGIVEDVMAERRFLISESTSLQEFSALLKTDSHTQQYDPDTVNALFEKLREKIVRRQDEDRHQNERQQRRRMDAFRSYMRHVEPPIEVTDTYEKVRPRLQNSEEFLALDSEDLRKAAFDKHIRRLKEKAEDRDKDRERERERRERERERERERDRERDRSERHTSTSHRRRSRDDSRNGYDSYTTSHKRSSRGDRDRERSRHPTRTPEPSTDPYEADRRRAAGERERQYRRRGSSARRSDRDSRADSRVRGESRARRESRDRRGDRTESIYDRERREREEERERQYSIQHRDRDEYRPSRRRRGLTPEDDDRDSKRSRRDRSPPPRLRSPPPPLSRERIFDDAVPAINYGDDPMINYGDDPYSAPTVPPSSSAPPKQKTSAPSKPPVTNGTKVEQKKPVAAAAAAAPSVKAGKADQEKMDVDDKAEASEEGEIDE